MIVIRVMSVLSFNSNEHIHGDPTSIRYENFSLYISKCKPHLIEPDLWD